MQPGHKFDDVPEGAADPVELPDHEGVAVADHLQRAGKAGAVGDGAGACVLLNSLRRDAGGKQRVPLQVKVLLGRGHPHVADQHRPPRIRCTNSSRSGFTGQRYVHGFLQARGG